jgi:hypothetical protein
MMNMKSLSLIVAVFIVVSSASAAGDGAVNLMEAARTSTYEFDAQESTVTETGGFAGFHRVYSIKGQIQLTVDPNAGTASFRRVDAKATDNSPFRRALDLNEVFNLSALPGTILDDGSVRFEGNVYDGSSVLITLVLDGATIHLRGETTPPLQSADFFSYELDAAAQRKYAGGTGEPDDPYRIGTAEQMNAIGVEPNDWDKHFQLTADIDLAAYGAKQSNIIGTEASPFAGVFQGNGHRISGFGHAPADANNVGLFGYVDGPEARIEALGLVDPIVDAGKMGNSGSLVGFLNQGTVAGCFADNGSVAGGSGVGGLIGVSKGLVTNCHATGEVLGGGGVGGLIGVNSGTVTKCHAEADVTGTIFVGGLVGFNDTTIAASYAAGHVVGAQGVGGLTGNNGLHADITNCYAVGSVGGDVRIGGLSGYNAGEIGYSYAGGPVDGNDFVGGLVGQSPAGLAWACLWDVEASGQSSSAGGTGKTTAEMHRADTFLAAGWDFVGETEDGTEDIWWIEEGFEYPRLAWERMPSDDPAIEIRSTKLEIRNKLQWPKSEGPKPQQ